MRYLCDVKEGEPIHGPGNVLESLEDLFRLLPYLGLSVSERLLDYTDVEEIKQRLGKTPTNRRLNHRDAEALRAAVQEMQKTCIAEADGIFAFVVSDKRLDVNKLLDDPGGLFSPGTFEKLSLFAQNEFVEAAKCIAFERATAAAFHLVRGTEEQLRGFYLATVKRDRVDLMWGPMVAHLRKRSQGPPRPRLDALDNIRVNFRNPTQHPDAVYDIHGAQDLWSVCVDAVSRIVKAMPEPKRAPRGATNRRSKWRRPTPL